MSVETGRWWVARMTPPPQSFPIRGFDRGGCIFATVFRAFGWVSECGKVGGKSRVSEPDFVRLGWFGSYICRQCTAMK